MTLVDGSPTIRRHRVAALNEVDRPAWLYGRAPLIVLVVELLASAALLLHYERHMWFYADDWDFLLNRSLGHDPLYALFNSHGGHWSTLPVLEYRLLWAIFGVKHYLPYALVVLALHLAAVVLLWVLLRRHGVNDWLATGLAGIVAFLGAGAADIIWDFQSGFDGSVVFGLIALVCVSDGKLPARRRWVVWLLLIGSLLCSGVSLPMVGFVTAYLLMRAGWRAAVWVVSVPAVVYLVWYGAIGHRGSGSSITTIESVPTFVWTGLTHTFGAVLNVAALGPIALILVAVPPLIARERTPLSDLAAAGIAAAVMLFISAGIARAQLGINGANAGRYVYIATIVMLPAVAFTVQHVLVRARWNLVLIVAVAYVVVSTVITGVVLMRTAVTARETALGILQPRILGAFQLARDKAPFLNEQPDAHTTGDITMTKLSIPGVLSKLPPGPVPESDILNAANHVQVLVSARPVAAVTSLTSLTGLTWTGVAPVSQANGCASASGSASGASVSVPVTGAGTQLKVITNGRDVTTVLRRGSLATPPNPWPTPGAGTAYVASDAAGSTLQIVLSPGQALMVCPAGS